MNCSASFYKMETSTLRPFLVYSRPIFGVEIRDLSRNAPYDYKGEINALWAAIRELQKEVAPPEPDDEWPEFVQPTGAGTAYQVGDKITFKGVRYVCRLPHCVWSPADYPIGWQKQA